MTAVTINANRLTADGKLHGSAAPDGSLLPILLGRMDVSMVADGVDLKGSSATQDGWSFDHQNSTITKLTDGDGSPFVRAAYQDRTGGGMSWPSIFYDFAGGASPQDVYVQFEARRDGSILSGSKFAKFYDPNNGGSQYANVTMKNGYTSSDVSSIAFGNGTGLTNDTQHTIWYETGHDDVAPIRYPSVPANVRTTTIDHGSSWSSSDWGNGTQWHKWQFRIKKNSGTSAETEVNDGVFEIWVDGVKKLGAYNIMNRHYSNALTYSRVEFISYMEANPAFTLDVKNITISKNGWID